MQDDKGDNDNGVFNGGTATFPDGKIGTALHLDGVDDYAEIPDSSSLDLTNSISVGFWIQTPMQLFLLYIALR